MTSDYLSIIEQADTLSMQEIAMQLNTIEPSGGSEAFGTNVVTSAHAVGEIFNVAQGAVDINAMLIMAIITLGLMAAASLAGMMTFSLIAKD